MAKSSFVSFHYQNDYWRVQQILRMGAIEGQEILPAQNWEAVKNQGDQAIKNWIDKEMARKSAVVVLIGAETANRKYVKYEIRKAWDSRKPLLGIRIHGLEDSNGNTSAYGPDPFAQFGFSDSDRTFADYVPVHSPAGRDSSQVYGSIKDNMASWVANGYKRP